MVKDKGGTLSSKSKSNKFFHFSGFRAGTGSATWRPPPDSALHRNGSSSKPPVQASMLRDKRIGIGEYTHQFPTKYPNHHPFLFQDDDNYIHICLEVPEHCHHNDDFHNE